MEQQTAPPCIDLHDADSEFLRSTTVEHTNYMERARLLTDLANQAQKHQQMFIGTLLQKAGAPAGANYRLSPDGTMLVPVVVGVPEGPGPQS